jgi:tRNA 2-thiocytidine biosynthesis protein TtcA
MSLVSIDQLRRSGKPPQSRARLERALAKRVGQAIADHRLIDDGDRIMVCISGGKDSYTLLHVLMDLARRAPVNLELIAVNIDQGWPGYRTDLIAAHLESTGVDYRMITEDYAQLVESKLRPGQTPCSLCSRFRRGVLYNLAEELGANKIALGHHMDDTIETALLNMFFAGRLSAMPAKLLSDDGRNTVIRPMIYVPEALVKSFQELMQFPVVRCGCPSCGLPEQQRQRIKRLLGDLEAENPGLKNHMLAALKNVSPSHLLDRSLLRPRKEQ